MSGNTQEDVEQPLLPATEDGEADPSAALQAAWMTFGIVVQLAWGFYTVVCRYMQTKAGMPTFFLTLMITLLASISLLIFVTLPGVIKSALAPKTTSAVLYETASTKKRALLQKIKFAGAIAICYFGVTTSSIGSLRYTAAYLNQLIMQTLPIWASLIQLLVLKTPLPPRTWTAISMVTVGGVMIVVGGAGVLTGGGPSFGMHDLIGCGFALITAVLLSIFFILVSKSSDVLSEGEILWCNYAVQFGLSAIVAFGVEKASFSILLDMGLMDWIILLIGGVGVMFGANFSQQLVIRVIGSPMFSTFTAAQVVAAVLGAWFVLNEKIENWLEALGMIVVVGSITWYLIMQSITVEKEEVMFEEPSSVISANGFTSFSSATHGTLSMSFTKRKSMRLGTTSEE